MHRRRPSLLLACVVLALLLSGCSDDSPDAEDATTTTAARDERGIPDVPAPEGFCEAYAAVDAIGADADADGERELEDLREDAQTFQASLADVVDTAPEELAAEVAVLVDAGEELVAIIDDADTLEAAETEAQAVFADGELDRANGILSGYAEQQCPQPEDDLPPPSSTETVPE